MACISHLSPHLRHVHIYYDFLLFSPVPLHCSIEMKYFSEYKGKTRSRVSFPHQDIAHVLFPTLTHLTGSHDIEKTLEILHLHVSKKLQPSHIDRVARASRFLQISQQLRPDLLVTLTVLFLAARFDFHGKCNTFHMSCPCSLLNRLSYCRDV